MTAYNTIFPGVISTLIQVVVTYRTDLSRQHMIIDTYFLVNSDIL